MLSLISLKELGAPGLDFETWESSKLDLARLVVLGADTTVVLDKQILGKPEDAADAARMLRLLSGRTHASSPASPWSPRRALRWRRKLRPSSSSRCPMKEIADYIASGEPMDKAGAYAIQGRASAMDSAD